MVESKKYSQKFFDEMEVNSIRSAKTIIPYVHDMLKPQSVIDVGCGTGAWLSVWNEYAPLKNYIGIDGSYVKKEMLRIPGQFFLSKDLKLPLDINEHYDIVMSLEVGEHLPGESAEQFVKSLVSLGNIVLFSAAIPGQTGTYHINEQYPEYWAAIFNKFDYVAVDYLRPKIWTSPDVEFYYKQNILLFVKKDVLKNYPVLLECAAITNSAYLTRIHPFLLELKVRELNNTKTLFGYLNNRWYKFKRKYIYKDPAL